MMKKLLSTVFAAILVVCMTVSPALAKGFNDISTTYVRDHYQLLSSSDLESFESQAANLSDKYGCNVYLTIVDNIGNYSARQYAEAYFTQNKLGSGADKNGIMFLIAVDSRDYVTVTHGQGQYGGITMFTDYRIAQIESDIVAQLKNNHWTEACATYLNDVEDTLSFYSESDKPWDVNNDPESAQTEFYMKLAATFLIPLLLAILLCGMWASQMKTARLKHEANDYFEEGSLVLTRKQDRYVTTTRNVVKIESDNNGGGGGSSISLSGFGGSSGGKF